MTDLIRSLLVRDRRRVVYECRRCGTSVDAQGDQCPYCGPTTDVVRHRLG